MYLRKQHCCGKRVTVRYMFTKLYWEGLLSRSWDQFFLSFDSLKFCAVMDFELTLRTKLLYFLKLGIYWRGTGNGRVQ